MMEHITRLSPSPTNLCQAERSGCRLRVSRCYRQPVVSLESCDGFPGYWPKHTIDRSVVVTSARQLFLNIHDHLIRRQSIVAIDRAVVHISHVRRITPCREPVARVPVPPAAAHKNDPIVVASPPPTIVPLPVVIAAHPIPLAAERVTVPVISDAGIASTIKGSVLCPVGREVSIPVHRYVVARTKLVGVSKTINVGVPHPIHRDVSVTIHVQISCPVDSDVSIAIEGSVASRAEFL